MGRYTQSPVRYLRAHPYICFYESRWRKALVNDDPAVTKLGIESQR